MARKRGYSPTIDDIRHYNIKKFRLTDDFDSLNLSQSTSPPPVPPAYSTKHTEYIPDIDTFLIHNQDDRDIIESSKLITDLETVDPNHIIIPESVLNDNIKLTLYDSELSHDRLRSRKAFEKRYGIAPYTADDGITTEEILHDVLVLKFWGLMKYYDPTWLVYNIWERWYFNVCKLHEFEQMDQIPEVDMDVSENDNDPDQLNDYPAVMYTPKIRNTYGGYYYDVSDESTVIHDDDDAMDLD